MTNIPKTLLLSRSVPPRVSGSSTMISNLARQFSQAEMIVVGAYKLGTPGVEWRPEYPKLRHATLQLEDGARGDRYVRWFQLPFLLLYVLLTIYTERCRIILCVYPDMIYLCAGYLAAVITGKPLFTYFHNTLTEARPTSPFARWLQARVFQRSIIVYVANDGMRAYYAQTYPRIRCETLFATFNEAMPSFEAAAPGVRSIHQPLRLAFSGSVNRSNRGAVDVIAAALPALQDTTLNIYSGTNAAMLKKMGLDGENVSVTSVSRDVLIAKLQEADIVLLPHGFTKDFSIEEERTIFPIKTLEYLLCGRPIVAIVPEDTYLSDFLRQHDCALLLNEPDAEQLQHAIRRLQADAALRERLVKNALNSVQAFYAPTVAGKLRDSLNHHMGRLVNGKQVQPDAHLS